jgi:hypothetical protein
MGQECWVREVDGHVKGKGGEGTEGGAVARDLRLQLVQWPGLRELTHFDATRRNLDFDIRKQEQKQQQLRQLHFRGVVLA